MKSSEEKYGKQLTKEQAIDIYQKEEWKNWGDEKIVKLQLFQDKLCIPIDRFHKAIEAVLGRPVFTHEFGLNRDGLIEEFLGGRDAPSLEEIINPIPEEKRIVIKKGDLT